MGEKIRLCKKKTKEWERERERCVKGLTKTIEKCLRNERYGDKVLYKKRVERERERERERDMYIYKEFQRL